MNAPSTPQIPLLDLDLLRTLVAIAEGGSFSAAAAQVHRTPSAVSMQVKRVEEIVGRAVFHRDSRSVSLTPDGAFLVDHARRMLAANRDAMARFLQPDLRGVVRLGATDDVAERFLAAMLARFAESHPGVVVDVAVDDSVNMASRVRSGDLDLALVTCDAEAPRGEVLLRERLVWAMKRGGLAAERDPLPVSVWEEGCIWRHLGLGALQSVDRRWRIAFQSAHVSGQRAAIRADLAVAPLPAAALEPGLAEAPARYGLPPLPDYGIALSVGQGAGPAVEAAAEHLRQAFAEAPNV